MVIYLRVSFTSAALPLYTHAFHIHPPVPHEGLFVPYLARPVLELDAPPRQKLGESAPSPLDLIAGAALMPLAQLLDPASGVLAELPHLAP